MQRNGIAGVAADGCFRYGKIAVAVLQRQLPFVSSVFGNRVKPPSGFPPTAADVKSTELEFKLKAGRTHHQLLIAFPE